MTGPRRVELMIGCIPAISAGEVLIRIHFNGMCTTDIAAWSDGPVAIPGLFGHEPVGEVVEVGPHVTSCHPGDFVTGRIYPSMADFVVADGADVVPLPENMDAGSALGEPLGCVVDALRRTPIDPSDRVAVVGSGFMGLCLTQLLRRTGASEVIAFDPRAQARANALENGADRAEPPGESFVAHHASFGVVFEVTGSQGGLDVATALAAQSATLSIIGYHSGSREVDMQIWSSKALNVVNAFVTDPQRMRDSIARGINLISKGRIDLAPLITHRFHLDQINQAFQLMTDKPDDYIKAVVSLS